MRLDGGQRVAALLIVRAKVEPVARDAFDTWYQNEHLPEAVEAFSAVGARRGWSELDDDVHVAFYEFRDMPDVNRVMASDALKRMIGEFDRLWSSQVTRTREVVELVQTI